MTAHHRRTRLRFVGLLTTIVATASLAIVATAGPASADPVITPASSYAVYAPSSVLAAAAAGTTISGVTEDQYGALLANSTKFNSDWLTTSVGQTMGGTSTLAPPPVTTLTPAELAELEALEASAAGAPAVAGAALTVGGLGSAVPLALAPGIMIGATADRVVGVDVTQGLCANPPTSSQIANQIIDAVTASDCASWAINNNGRTALYANLGTLTTGGLTCYPDDATKCLQIIGPAAGGYPGDYCLRATGTGFVGMLFSDNASAPYMSTGFSAGVDSGEWQCAGDPIGTWAWETPSRTAVTGYCATPSATCDGTTIATLTTTQNDPLLHFNCQTTMTNSAVVSQNSDTFRTSDPTMPKPVMPAVPTGDAAAKVQCFLIGGTTDIPVTAPLPTTTAFQNWVTNDPECQNGSCLVDLKLNGQSCLFSTVSCDGWVTDPTRSDDYKCYVGTHLAPISECYIYGTTFNQGDRSSGHGYANPTNGQITEGETSESDLDELTGDLINRGQEQWGPTGSGLLLGGGGTAAVASEAAAIAAYCLLQLGTVTACLHVRIFSPGLDINQAAQHDLEAILGTGTGPFDSPIPKGPFLTYAATSPVSSGWYNSTPPCSTGTYDTDLLQCDEYPFRSTTTAGPGASLRTIDKVQNGAEGLYLQHFYQACGLNQPNDTGVFFVAPQPTLPTSEWCT